MLLFHKQCQQPGAVVFVFSLIWFGHVKNLKGLFYNLITSQHDGQRQQSAVVLNDHCENRLPAAHGVGDFHSAN